MYPILILRSEIICLILLLFTAVIVKRYGIRKSNRSFALLLTFAIIHVVFDGITVYTVNQTDTIPTVVNNICHILFYLSALAFSSEFLLCTFRICMPAKKQKQQTIISYALFALYVVCLPFLKIEYTLGNGSYSSAGSAAYMGYACAFINFICAFIVMVISRKKIQTNVVKTLFPVTFVAIIIVVAQVFVRELLFTGAAVTICTLGFFFSDVNPTQVVQQKIAKDSVDSFKTKSDFDKDIIKFNEVFNEDKTKRFIIVRCAIDNIMDVNNNFGHNEGDNYISLCLNTASKTLTNCTELYRASGSEFNAIYIDKDEETVKKDLSSLKTSIKISASSMQYKPSVSAGYAVSSETHNGLEEVVAAAEFSLYKSKEASKNGADLIDDTTEGISINITGLSDYMFDAMCIGNGNDYPYILNVKTNVMRIPPKWQEEFGIANAIMYDLATVWINHIHPDDRQAFIDDFTATMAGKQEKHDCWYRSMDKNGVYVKCHCQGGLFKNDAGIQLFAGHMSTHGPVDNQ